MSSRVTATSGAYHGIRVLLVGIMLMSALGALPSVSLAAVRTNYFVPQVFSHYSTTSAGSLAGNSFTVSAGGTFDAHALSVGAFTPGSLPPGSGFPNPAPANSGLEWGSTSSTATVAFQFTNPLTPACHIFVDDVDIDEIATFQFYDAGNNLLDPSTYLVNPISTSGLPTVEQTAAHIKFTSIGGGQSEPTHEIIPNAATVSKIVVTGTNSTSSGGSIAVYFACSQPPLSKAFSPSSVQQNQVSTLTFTIDSINGNSIWQAGFNDSLPTGLQVASPANATNTCANGSSVTATAGGSSISFSGLTLPFNNSLGSCTVSVDVINKPGRSNASCAGNPAEFSNGASNVATSTLNTSGLSTACLVVTPPVPLPAGYFVPQVFSAFDSPSAGSLAGNSFAVSTSGSIDTHAPARGAFTPGNLPPNSGFPSPAPANSGLEWGSSSSATTVTFQFTSPLSPACHILVDDVDFNEVATLQFYDVGNSLLDPSGYLVNPISTSGLPTLKQTSTHIKFTGLGSGQSEPTYEIIPNAATVSKIVVTGTNSVSSGSIAAYFTCSQPPLSKAFNPSTILKSQASVTTLTFTIASINGNPIWQAGFTDTLPTGLLVASSPNVSNTCGSGSSVAATPGGSSISFSGLILPFNNSLGSCTLSVDVVNKPSQINPSCAGNPAEFTNSTSNMTTLTLNTSGMTPACLTVVLPTAVELAGFWATPAGGQVLLTWETASEIDNLGFNVHRAGSAREPETQLNGELIASTVPGSPLGAQYVFLDGAIEPGTTYFYWLETVEVGGATSWHGPVTAAVYPLYLPFVKR